MTDPRSPSMHIVLLAPDLCEGSSGWSRYARDLAAALAQKGHKVTALVREKSNVDFAAEYAVLRQPTSYIGNPLPVFWSAVRMYFLLKKLKPDVVHAIAEPYGLILGLLGNRKYRTCMTIHGTYAVSLMEGRTWTARLMKRAYRNIHAIIAVSNFTKRYVRKHAPSLFDDAALETKITVIGNGVDVSRSSFVPEINHSPKRILSIGAVKSRKGYRQAIEACATLRKQSTLPFRYDIVGSLSQETPYVDSLHRMILERGLKDIVRLRGQLPEEELKALLKDADLLLMTSVHEGHHVEGFGLVLLEANAWGIPVIAPTSGGCPEAVSEGVSGYVRDPDNPTEIADAMEKILVQGSIDRDACRRWAEEHAIEKVAEGVEEVFRRAVGC